MVFWSRGQAVAEEAEEGDGARPVFRVVIRLREEAAFRDAGVALCGGGVGKLAEPDGEEGPETQEFAGEFVGAVPGMKEDAGEGAVALSLAEDVQQLAPGAHAVEVDEAVVPEGGAEVDVQQDALGFQGVAVFGGGIQPAFSHAGLWVACEPVIQLKGELGGVCLSGVPGVNTEAGGHARGGGDAFPVCAVDGAEVASIGGGVVGMVIFHAMGKGAAGAGLVQEVVFAEAVEGLGASRGLCAQDDVVKEGDVHELPALGNGFGEFYVGIAGGGVAAGVVVCHDEAGGVADDGGAEDGAGVGGDGGEGAAGDEHAADELFAAVEQEEDEVFLCLIAQVADEIVVYCARAAHFGSLQILADGALPQLEGGGQGGGLGGADSLAAFHDFPGIHGTEVGERTGGFFDAGGELQHGAALQPGMQEEGNEFLIAEGAAAVAQHLFAGHELFFRGCGGGFHGIWRRSFGV